MTISDLDLRREEAAIKRIESQGVKHLYTYNPDGEGRRYVFDTLTLGGTVIIGLLSLENYAGIGKKLMYVDMDGLAVVLGSARLRKLLEAGYLVSGDESE